MARNAAHSAAFKPSGSGTRTLYTNGFGLCDFFGFEDVCFFLEECDSFLRLLLESFGGATYPKMLFVSFIICCNCVCNIA